jgi:CBS domain-containing protein
MNESVQEVMTPAPCAISPSDSAMTAARTMRANDIGDVIVLEDNRLFGILTDRDIVVRVIAEGANPNTTMVGAICSRDLTTITPTASAGEAVRLMRDKAIRRLPVVDESNQVIGIVSLGDLAVERDRRTALADISAAPPNV